MGGAFDCLKHLLVFERFRNDRRARPFSDAAEIIGPKAQENDPATGCHEQRTALGSRSNNGVDQHQIEALLPQDIRQLPRHRDLRLVVAGVLKDPLRLHRYEIFLIDNENAQGRSFVFPMFAVEHRNQIWSFKKDTDANDISRYGLAIFIFY